MLLPRFEQIVKERVIDRLDQKDLNEDTAEFRRVSPSVENIAWVIRGMLAEYTGLWEPKGSGRGRRSQVD